MANTIENDAEFTIRSANKTLPLIRRIVADIVVLSKRLTDTRSRLEYLAEGRPESEEDLYSSELKAIEDATEGESRMLDEFIRELLLLNAIPTSAHLGYVDFLAQRENEQVCLCWKQGENEVMHWHRIDEDCSKRRLVDLPLIRQSGERQTTRPV